MIQMKINRSRRVEKMQQPRKITNWRRIYEVIRKNRQYQRKIANHINTITINANMQLHITAIWSIICVYTVHTGEKPFHCDFCDFSAAQSGDLKKHLPTHTGEKQFHCKKCNLSFARRSHLKVHMITHTSEKPFQCKKCDFASAYESYLGTHMRTHTGEKPFQCDQCEYSAAQRCTLRTHMRLHTGEKPFQCDRCLKKFRQKPHLKSHKCLRSDGSNGSKKQWELSSARLDFSNKVSK